MALVKGRKKISVVEEPSFERNDDAIIFFEQEASLDRQAFAIDYLAKTKEGATYLVNVIEEQKFAQDVLVHIASALAKMDSKVAPIERVMDLLKHENAYIRNLGISILQDYGEAIEYYIVKFLIGNDRDLRIFAVNVLGDVAFAQSRMMLVELLETEQDVNVAMTAVDYLAEIGEEEDIALLETVKERFKDEYYAVFAVDQAIACIKG
jgi:HEAT repeat protein